MFTHRTAVFPQLSEKLDSVFSLTYIISLRCIFFICFRQIFLHSFVGLSLLSTYYVLSTLLSAGDTVVTTKPALKELTI